MTIKTVRALRVDPADFKSMGADLNEAHTSTTTALDLADDEIDAYAKVQQGPDADLIVSSARATIEGVRSSVAGYPDLVEAFDAAYSTTFRLDGDSDALWDEVVLFDGEMTPDDEAGFEQRFDDIRSAEESAMATLADAIEAAETGDDIELDAGVPELIGRLIGIVEDADTDADLAIAQLLVADYAEDGDFDTSKDVEEALKADGIDPNVLEAILNGAEFPDDKRFSEDEIEALLSGELDSDIAVDILEDPELEFPDEELMDSIEEAMAEGRKPTDASIDERYFPTWYVEYLENEEKIRDAESRRDKVDGVRIVPDWLDPSDRQEPRAEIDRELKELREAQQELQKEHNIDEDGRVDAITAIATTGERLAGDHWKGKRLASPGIANSDRPRVVSEIAEHPESSTGFFNALGGRTEAFARLLEMGPEGEDSMKVLSIALGEATRHRGGNELDFDGTEFGERAGHEQVISDLLIEGDFDEDFWVDATVQLIVDRPQGPREVSVAGDPPRGSRVLSKASEDPALTNRVIQELEKRDPDFAALLGKDPYGGGGEALAEFLAVSGNDSETASKILIAGSEYEEFSDPGTAAGVDAIMAQHVTILYDEEYLASHGIYPDETGRLSQEEMERLGFGPDEWNTLAENVHEHGFGGFTAAGNEQLMFEAMQNHIEARNRPPSFPGQQDDPLFDGIADPFFGDANGTAQPRIFEPGDGKPNFERFAYVSGVLNEQEFQARLAIANDNDASAKSKNQKAQIATSVAAALFISGAIATPTPIDDAAILSLDIGAGTGISLFFPEFWETGEAFEVTEADRRENQSDNSRRRTQGRLAWLQATGEEIDVPVKDNPSLKVTVSVVNETVQDPETGVAITRPVIKAVDHTGNPWQPKDGESLDWNGLDPDPNNPHPVNQSGSTAVNVVGSEQGADEVQARESSTEAPGPASENSFEDVSPEDRKAADPWLGL